ncbi:unnamed protein product [Schistosoma mattheei]|uniref:Uncharacterized protein n=1 Tax=Schistosoma mattheei TaxID=31246 RepID=A0A183NEJ6_9TREM|nr:unnamed protein product [Schistosoma mattheei]
MTEDENHFFDIIRQTCSDIFRTNIDKILSHLSLSGRVTDNDIRNLLFGNYIQDDSCYDEVTDYKLLIKRMENYLNDYNTISKTPMNLVMFKYAIEHISRVARVLLQDNGHALLVGCLECKLLLQEWQTSALELWIRREVVEHVDNFTYFGGLTKSQHGFKKLAWRKQNVRLSIKGRICCSAARSVLLYRRETGPLRVEDTRKLLVFDHRCLRSIACICWDHRVSNNDVKYGVLKNDGKSVDEVVSLHRLRWLGHVLRVGGSGRQSATRLASHIADHELLVIEITRTYGVNEWRDDIKRLLLKTGLEAKSTVFLITDNQLKHESFMEDISMLLNSGDVPNLFPPDEKAELIDKVQNIVRLENIPFLFNITSNQFIHESFYKEIKQTLVTSPSQDPVFSHISLLFLII